MKKSLLYVSIVLLALVGLQAIKLLNAASVSYEDAKNAVKSADSDRVAAENFAKLMASGISASEMRALMSNRVAVSFHTRADREMLAALNAIEQEAHKAKKTS